MKRVSAHQFVFAGRMVLITALAGGISAPVASAQPNNGPPACSGLPDQAALESALDSSVGVAGNGGARIQYVGQYRC
jgi:hypothetical protein